MAETVISMICKHYEYGILAKRIIVSLNHKETSNSFTETMIRLHNYDKYNDSNIKLIPKSIINFLVKFKEEIDGAIIHKNDYKLDYFGFCTLYRKFFLRIDSLAVERY